MIKHFKSILLLLALSVLSCSTFAVDGPFALSGVVSIDYKIRGYDGVMGQRGAACEITLIGYNAADKKNLTHVFVGNGVNCPINDAAIANFRGESLYLVNRARSVSWSGKDEKVYLSGLNLAPVEMDCDYGGDLVGNLIGNEHNEKNEMFKDTISIPRQSFGEKCFITGVFKIISNPAP